MKKFILWVLPLALVLGLLQPPRPVLADNDPKATPTVAATPDEDEVSEDEAPPLFLAEVKGDVRIQRRGDVNKAQPPQEIQAEDHILTAKDSTAFLLIRGGGTIEVGPHSDFKVREFLIDPKTMKAKFQMAFGQMKAILHKLTSPSSCFEIEAGGVVSGVRGTTFGVTYDKDKKEETTKTYEGTVYAKVNGKEKLVEKGFGLVVGKGGSPLLAALAEDDMADFAAFLDSNTDLEKKKQIILKQMIKGSLEHLLNKKTNPKKDPVGLQFHF